MSIKRYSTFGKKCNCNSNAIHIPKKAKKKLTSTKKGLLGILAIVFIFLAIALLFNIPFLSLGLEDREKKIDNQKLDKSSVEANSQIVLAGSDAAHNESEFERGLKDITEDLEKINIREEQPADGELKLRYQQKEKNIRVISGQLKAGETLYQYLVKNDISPAEVLRLQEKVHSVVDISYLNIGTKFAVHCDDDGEIVQFDYQPNQLDAYQIKIPSTEMANIEVTKDEIFREIVCFEGEIETSLYQSMLDYCNSGQLAVQLAEIFAWDIDFLTECQPGDTFKLIVEKLYRGDFYRWGDILAAVYEGEMLSIHTAILFEDSSGNANYYNENGKALQKAFLRAPLNYKYISSHYTESRYHPILRIYRPHLAIDYAAPTGTPVVSIGAGTVISRYYDQGGYGNYVEIKHPNGYVTAYGHLSKFAQGLHVGLRVEQGEVIGYVGATGLATGPHLDFSISKDGNRFNFLELDMPPASSVAAEYLDDFTMVKENYLSILDKNI